MKILNKKYWLPARFLSLVFMSLFISLIVSGCQTAGGPNMVKLSSNLAKENEIIHESPREVVEKNGDIEFLHYTGGCTKTHKEVLSIIELLIKQPTMSIPDIKSNVGIKKFCHQAHLTMDVVEDARKIGVTPSGLVAQYFCEKNIISADAYIRILDKLILMGDSVSKVNIKIDPSGLANVEYTSLLDKYLACPALVERDNEGKLRDYLISRANQSLTVEAFRGLNNPEQERKLFPLIGDINQNTGEGSLKTKFEKLIIDESKNYIPSTEDDFRLIRLALENGADPNLSYGAIPPLYYVLGNLKIPSKSKITIANLLLEYGADPHMEFNYSIVGRILIEPSPFFYLADKYVYGEAYGGYPGDNSSVSIEDFMSILKWSIDRMGLEYDSEVLHGTLKYLWLNFSKEMTKRLTNDSLFLENYSPTRVSKRVDELLNTFK